MSRAPSARISQNRSSTRTTMNKPVAAANTKEDKKAAEEERMDEVFQNNFHIVTALLPTVTFRCKIIHDF